MEKQTLRSFLESRIAVHQKTLEQMTPANGHVPDLPLHQLSQREQSIKNRYYNQLCIENYQMIINLLDGKLLIHPQTLVVMELEDPDLGITSEGEVTPP